MKRTPLFNEHIKAKGKMVEFGGWEMPVLYTGVIEEHLAVRNAAGLFDVSHMGQFEFKGKDALKCVNHLTTNDAEKLVNGQAVYSLLCNEKGTPVDDVIVYRFNPEHMMLVVNAANIDKDWAWVTSHVQGDVKVTNRSDDFALIAIQGPKAAEIVQKITKADLSSIKTFHFAYGNLGDVNDCLLARTGYTGEDGFELFMPPDKAAHIWQLLLETGKPMGLVPVGLGARDTLRLEMKYTLYGHEMNEGISPLEAGLNWVVKLAKSDFIGKAAIEKLKAEGIKRKVVGFTLTEAGIPRDGYKVFDILADGSPSNEPIGHVTSGTMSPSLKKPIGCALVPVAKGAIGSKFFVDIRGRMRLAEVIETPFYKK